VLFEEELEFSFVARETDPAVREKDMSASERSRHE